MIRYFRILLIYCLLLKLLSCNKRPDVFSPPPVGYTSVVVEVKFDDIHQREVDELFYQIEALPGKAPGTALFETTKHDRTNHYFIKVTRDGTYSPKYSDDSIETSVGNIIEASLVPHHSEVIIHTIKKIMTGKKRGPAAKKF